MCDLYVLCDRYSEAEILCVHLIEILSSITDVEKITSGWCMSAAAVSLTTFLSTTAYKLLSRLHKEKGRMLEQKAAKNILSHLALESTATTSERAKCIEFTSRYYSNI